MVQGLRRKVWGERSAATWKTVKPKKESRHDHLLPRTIEKRKKGSVQHKFSGQG